MFEFAFHSHENHLNRKVCNIRKAVMANHRICKNCNFYKAIAKNHKFCINPGHKCIIPFVTLCTFFYFKYIDVWAFNLGKLLYLPFNSIFLFSNNNYY